MNDISYPFLRSAFLGALESSGSVSAETGWEPIHLKIENPETSIFMPLYLKNHSMGEYVFDYPWANAYHQHGLDYYPKLVTAIPFTPSTGDRIRSDFDLNAEHCDTLFSEVMLIANETKASSWHILFPNDLHLNLLYNKDLLQRSAVQYHWINTNYESFEHYLLSMTSRKRKMIKKERRHILDQNIHVEILDGTQISHSMWIFFYQLYERTYAKRNGTRGYLTSQFFTQIAQTMPEQIAMSVATKNSQPIACALYLFDENTLYGRYWGSIGDYQFLHFELCYYQGIEFAIKKGLDRYDAGAQGEQKLVRGFQPVKTYSLHWIKQPEFREAIDRFLNQESEAVNHHIEQAKELLPFKSP